tara:strand:+ start:16413 stop:16964 length:552 start_codon:yes stop_codon:yes gene_type:complete
MKLFFDTLPIILFFVAYKAYDIYVATITAIVAIAAQIAFMLLRGKRPETTQWATLGIIVVLGGATLYLHDEMFIKWKPTAVYWLFALAFLGSRYIGQKTLVERMLGKNLSLPTKIWSNLNFGWVAFFIVMGFLNLYVVYNFDTDTWVNFKLFGILGITFVFILIQAALLAKFIPKNHEENNSN